MRHSKAAKEHADSPETADQAPATDVGAVLELLYQLESGAGAADPVEDASPPMTAEEAIQHIQTLHDEVRAAAERCEAFLAGPGAKKRFRAAVDAEREALTRYGFDSYAAFSTSASLETALPNAGIFEQAPLPTSTVDANDLNGPLRERVSELLGLSCATRDVAIVAAKAALTRAASSEFVSAKIAGMDPPAESTPADSATTIGSEHTVNSSHDNAIDESPEPADEPTTGHAPNDMLRMVEAIGAVRAPLDAQPPTPKHVAPVDEGPAEPWTVEVPAVAAPSEPVVAKVAAETTPADAPIVERTWTRVATTPTASPTPAATATLVAPSPTSATNFDTLLAPLSTLGEQIYAAIEATQIEAARSLAAIAAEGDRVHGILQEELRGADEARAEVAAMHDRAQQQAAAVVDAAVKEAEQLKAEAVAEVERVRDRLSRLSAEVFSVAAELEG